MKIPKVSRIQVALVGGLAVVTLLTLATWSVVQVSQNRGALPAVVPGPNLPEDSSGASTDYFISGFHSTYPGLDELRAEATAIVTGSVVSSVVEIGPSPGTNEDGSVIPGLPITMYTLRVKEVFKGQISIGRDLVLVAYGGETPEGDYVVEGASALVPGEEYLFFLGDSDGGAYSALAGQKAVAPLQPDGSYLLSPEVTGEDELPVTEEELRNRPPDLSKVKPSDPVLWPPSGHFQTIRLLGAKDPDGDRVQLTMVGVTQDEPVGRQAPDARRCHYPSKVQLRAERDGQGDGRVYRVAFKADDGKGGIATGTVKVSVPHNLRRSAKDSAPPSYDSLVTRQGKSHSLHSRGSHRRGGRC